MADEFFFSKAVLVWFQAEETTSDSKIFVGKLPQEQRIRTTYRLAYKWADSPIRPLAEADRLLLGRTDTLPVTLYLDIV